MREVRDWGVLCVCVREKSAETKEAAAAFNVPVVCPSPKPQAETTSPPRSLSPPLWPFFMLHTAATRRRYRRGETDCVIRWKLRTWKGKASLP